MSSRQLVGARSQPGVNPTAPLAVQLAARSPSRTRALLRGWQPSQAYAAGGSLYLTRNVTPPADAHRQEVDQLVRTDPMSGRVLAVRALASTFDEALLVDGALWVTTTGLDGTSLWRLDPRSLASRSRTILPNSEHTVIVRPGSLAFAGGSLWSGTATLNRISIASGQVERVVNLGYPGGVDVVADPTGRVLLASIGYEHPAYVAGSTPTPDRSRHAPPLRGVATNQRSAASSTAGRGSMTRRACSPAAGASLFKHCNRREHTPRRLPPNGFSRA
jgi:hypothetical protein